MAKKNFDEHRALGIGRFPKPLSGPDLGGKKMDGLLMTDVAYEPKLGFFPVRARISAWLLIGGIVTCVVFIVPVAYALIGGAALAILAGNPFVAHTGRGAQFLLKTSVVGLGAGIHLGVVLAVGVRSAGTTAVTILLSLAFGLWLARRMALSRELSVLISVGTAICGGSAIAAVAGVIRPKAHETAIALGVVFLLNAVALFLFPPIGAALGLSERQFGVWAALAIHDTSSVVGAALTYGREATEVATTTKLVRALWIAPVTLLIALWWARQGQGGPQEKLRFPVPGFILGFLAVAALFTYFEPLAPWGGTVAGAARRLFACTLFLIGAGFSREALRHIGMRPVIFAVMLWLAVSVTTATAVVLEWI